MEGIDPGVTKAIEHAVEAGKLRTYVRENGDGLAGLERLADRHSADARTALSTIFEPAPGMAAPKFSVTDRPGSR